MADRRDALRNVRTFPQLVKFLRDEMDWPIESGNFEDLTFDYTAEELGIDTANAAKIREIKRLRPLSVGQPWGIFFVKFEPKRLPVVALRRVLSRVVLKKRASANSTERAAWKADDLLFISNYGEGDDRQISFAHFSSHSENADLPTLMVLGWDSGNTALHLDDVADKLTTKLSWPQHEEDKEHWRERWRSAFTLRHREVITTSKALAERLADLARSIRERANAVLKIESDKGPLRKLHVAFREALIHDLTEDDFADMYAQTISYGLLTARVSRPSGLVAENLRDMIPVTNPFLKDLLESFLAVGGRKGKVDFDELGVGEVVQLLRDADMEAVLRDFGDRNPEEDPAIHFYELFLREYDPKKRMQRGVFYTPRPVVSYIVRSVHEILQTEFGLEEGLASTVTWAEMAEQRKDLEIPDGVSPDSAFVQILDPATGTATFLVEVIDVMHRTLAAQWRKQRLTETQQLTAWNAYVPKHLLPRLHGYELMMAPYAIAHMKIGLKLYETGYRFGSEERARIYLTNALEPASDDKKQREFEAWAPALARESRAVNTIKRKQRYTVVIGNPPYSTLSQNRGVYIETLMDRYKVTVRTGEIQRQALSNDYVKFVCLSSEVLTVSPLYTLAMITDNSYLDGPLFRDMRENISNTFCSLDVLNLHGNSRKRATSVHDENVFDIQQGVAILVGRCSTNQEKKRMGYQEIIGTRDEKTRWLLTHDVGTAAGVSIGPKPPHYFFLPRTEESSSLWDTACALPDIFAGARRSGRALPFNGAALATRQDDLTIAFEVPELIANLEVFFDKRSSKAALRERYRLCRTSHFSFERARAEVTLEAAKGFIRPILYRPFDFRFVVYHPLLIGEPRTDVMGHLLHDNLALLTTRRVTGRPFDNVFVTRGLVEYKAATHDRNTQVFPLYLYDTSAREGSAVFWREDASRRIPNLDPEWMARWKERTCRSDPGDILNYIYALLHSPIYRTKFRERLSEDYARILMPVTPNLAAELSLRGAELIAVHLLDSPRLDKYLSTYVGPRNPEVEKISYAGETVWLDKAARIGFKGVSEQVWNFHIGGYQVCEKWLKDRKGRTLSKDEITHYHKIVVALNETIRIMAEIDSVIDAHGGWPAAFTVTKN